MQLSNRCFPNLAASNLDWFGRSKWWGFLSQHWKSTKVAFNFTECIGNTVRCSAFDRAFSSLQGKTFSIWKLNDLHNLEVFVSLLLFGEVHKEHWKTEPGMVIGLLNPNPMKQKDGYDGVSGQSGLNIILSAIIVNKNAWISFARECGNSVSVILS